MKKLLLILLSITYIFPLSAQTKEKADSAYATEKYDEAIAIYTDLLKGGAHADIYYNLGNCYYKTDQIALAILNYERAILLEPGNSDIRYNLDLAQTKTVDKIIPESEMFFITWGKNIVNLTGMDGWASIGVIAFIQTCILLLIFFFSKRIVLKKAGFFTALVMLVVVILSNVFAHIQHENISRRTGAIVMSNSVVVKSTPNESGTDLFVLHEGTRIEIIDDSMKDWKEIKLADGKIGWMPAETMEVI